MALDRIAPIASLTVAMVLTASTVTVAFAETPDGASAAQSTDWMENAAPGEHHKHLEPYVGSWDVETTMWWTADSPPQTSTGRSDVEWILDGRFLREEFTGEFEMGGQTHPFSGLGLFGYDNAEGEYISIWLDNMGTGILEFDEGEYDAETQSIKLEAEFDDPMSGQEVEMTAISRVVDENKLHFEMYKELDDGERFKCLEMIYTRRD